MLDLFSGLSFHAGRVEVTSVGFTRANFNSRPWKKAVTATVKFFFRKAPLVEVVNFLDRLEPDLSERGFEDVENKILQMLKELMHSAAKDGQNFLVLVKSFLLED
jgi:hypothetical protein